MKLLYPIISLLLVLSCSSSEDSNPAPSNPITPTPVEPPAMRADFSGVIRDMTSAELVGEMGVGWNLGNSFDVIAEDKTFWGNPLPTSGQISTVKQMGFGTLRIPVTWAFHQRETFPYTIEADYLNRVTEVVNYGLSNQMHVIINVHHDDDWILPTFEASEQVVERLGSLWTQVAEHFQLYGDSLIFETLNEPRLKGSPEEWSGGTSEGREVINLYHQAALDAIRATGGNNERRHIMISTYAASTVPDAMEDLVIPNDDPNIIISQHSYFPWVFAGQEDGVSEWGTEQERADLSQELDRIRDKWITQEGRPVILGEWGTVDRNNLAERVEYTRYYAEEAIARGMLPIVWDDGGNFGLLDRGGLVWRFPEIARTIVAAGE